MSVYEAIGLPLAGALVPLVLSGAKVETRRVMEDQPGVRVLRWVRDEAGGLYWPEPLAPEDRRIAAWPRPVRCPYGEPGAWLYVKEKWRIVLPGEHPQAALEGGTGDVCGEERRGLEAPATFDGYGVEYAAGGAREVLEPEGQAWLAEAWARECERACARRAAKARRGGGEKHPQTSLGVAQGEGLPPTPAWRSGRFLARLGARVFMRRRSEARLERLSGISDGAAIREGFRCRAEFLRYWDDLNAKRPGRRVSDDPWVWVVGWEWSSVEVRGELEAAVAAG